MRPPEPEDCPEETYDAMWEELRIHEDYGVEAVVDINQPGDVSELGTYQDGPVISRVVEGAGRLPVGTLLHGRLWTGPGIYEELGDDRRVPGVLGRYTLAVLPDGQKHPVCIVLGSDDGRVAMDESSKPGAVRIPKKMPLTVVKRWP